MSPLPGRVDLDRVDTVSLDRLAHLLATIHEISPTIEVRTYQSWAWEAHCCTNIAIASPRSEWRRFTGRRAVDFVVVRRPAYGRPTAAPFVRPWTTRRRTRRSACRRLLG